MENVELDGTSLELTHRPYRIPISAGDIADLLTAPAALIKAC
jgi:hypothetical protein